MIKTVLIDIDNTLLCFYKSAEHALRTAFSKGNVEFKQEYLPAFFKISDRLWQLVEDGVIRKEDIYEMRLRALFNQMGIVGDGRKMEDLFLKEMSVTAKPVDGAKELLEYLSSKYKVYAASNSSYERQQSRLKIAGLYGYLDGLLVSDRAGVHKPAKEFFEYCIKSSNTLAENCIMIGDSLKADIVGAKNLGIKTLWYNHENSAIPSVKPYDFYAQNLYDIMKIL